MTASVIPLPLDILDDHRTIDRLAARALHLAVWPCSVSPDPDDLVRIAGGSTRALLLTLARFERALASEPSSTLADAAWHLRRALAATLAGLTEAGHRPAMAVAEVRPQRRLR